MLQYLRTWMVEAYRQAMESPDPSSQNGAVIVGVHGVRSAGFNRIHPALPQDYQNREAKYKNVTHAEQAAVFDAARRGHATPGLEMFCPWAACTVCARFIVEAQLSRVYVHGPRMHIASNWDDEIKEAHTILKRGGVRVITYDEPLNIPGLEILISGKLWKP